MTAANDSAAEKPDSAGESIKLPPPPDVKYGVITPEEVDEEIGRLDSVLAALVLLVAFLLASFAIRNSDFWMHLAAGRLVATGNYSFGTDPFSYTAGDTYWANHAWLFDLVLYGLAQAGGGLEAPAAGTILVLFRAVLVVALAYVLLRTRRPGRSLWAPAVCTLLGILALSPRLFLQPTLASFLLLGLTLYLLTARKPGEKVLAAGLPGRLALLPVLFALWANLDAWFFLGPVTVLLFLVGQWVQQTVAPIRTGDEAPEPNELRTLGLVLGAGLVACLLNPHHYHAFALPPELYSPTLDALRARDPRYISFPSPWVADYFQGPNVGRSAAGVAYFPLVALGILSFILNYRDTRWWRVAVWVPFFVLSCYQARLIPFFAVVAAPIAALNLQDFALRAYGTVTRVERGWRLWSLLGRAGTGLAVAALALCAWPGWLHPGPDNPRISRRVTWSLEPDESLRRVAQQLGAWYESGALKPTDRGYHSDLDLPSYFAWYAPQAKGFFDFRFPLFAGVATQYLDVQHKLGLILRPGAKDPGAGQGPRPEDWRRVFRAHHINHLILSRLDRNEGTFLALLSPGASTEEWGHWGLEYLDGMTAVYRWHQPSLDNPAPTNLRAPSVDPVPQAFGASLDPERDRAPSEGPGRSPQTPDWWRRFRHGTAPESLDAHRAERYLKYYRVYRENWSNSFSGAALAPAWAAGGSIQPGAGFAPVIPMLPMRTFIGVYLNHWGEGPPAALVVATRAARRAIAANPDDWRAYKTLVEVYATLAQFEDGVNGQLRINQPFLVRQLRRVQLATALHHYGALAPNDLQVQNGLFSLYLDLGYKDLALDRARDRLKLFRTQGRELFPLTADQFSDQVRAYEEEIQEIEKDLTESTKAYEEAAANQPYFARTQIARGYGLARKALELLNATDVPADLMGPDEQILFAATQVWMLLTTGQIDQVRTMLAEAPQTREQPGYRQLYDWYSLLVAAAMGNYKAAGETVQEMTDAQRRGVAMNALRLSREQTFQGALNPLRFLEQGSLIRLPDQALQALEGQALLGRGMGEVPDLADLLTLRGILALEEGDTPAAARAFQEALDLDGSGGTSDYWYPSRGAARRYLELLRAGAGRP